jgi:hypothetical protein
MVESQYDKASKITLYSIKKQQQLCLQSRSPTDFSYQRSQFKLELRLNL